MRGFGGAESGHQAYQAAISIRQSAHFVNPFEFFKLEHQYRGHNSCEICKQSYLLINSLVYNLNSFP